MEHKNLKQDDGQVEYLLQVTTKSQKKIAHFKRNEEYFEIKAINFMPKNNKVNQHLIVVKAQKEYYCVMKLVIAVRDGNYSIIMYYEIKEVKINF